MMMGVRDDGTRNGGHAGESTRRVGTASETPRVAILTCEESVPTLGVALEQQGAAVLQLPLYHRIEGTLRRFRPDTIVLTLCRSTPYRTLNALQSLHPELQRPLVLLLTPDTHYEMLPPYMDAGVDDVVNPPHSASAILLRRYIQLRGPGRFDSDAAIRREVRLGSLLIDVPRRHVTGTGEDLELSGREFELLLQLVAARGEVVPRTELMSEIWGAETGSEAVLDATVHRLRRKLDRAGDEGTRVATVRGVGYQLDLDPGTGIN